MKHKLSHAGDRLNRNSISVELFVQAEFSDLEVASVVTVLEMANRVLDEARFDWHFVSDAPGLVKGRCGMIVRAAPSVFDVGLKDVLVVVGGKRINAKGWMPRVRAMLKRGRPIVILSDASTAFIVSQEQHDVARTTQWQDVYRLTESGNFPYLSATLAATGGGIVTSAGSGYTMELILKEISRWIGQSETADIGSRLMIETLRDRSFEQPKASQQLAGRFDAHLENAIQIMETHIEEPLSTIEIASQVGISPRQLERLFNRFLQSSPAKYYRQLRVRRAHYLVIGTSMSLLDVALATGFAAVSTLSSAYRDEYDMTPAQMRNMMASPGS